MANKNPGQDIVPSTEGSMHGSPHFTRNTRLFATTVSSLRRQSGFTMVELVTAVVIAGILAAMAAPHFFDSNVFTSRGFYDQAVSTLRYAQKAAIAQHRFVCVTVGANSIILTYDPVPPGVMHTAATCPGSPLTNPTGQSPYTVTAPNDVALSGGAAFNFDALGKPSAAQSISVSGYASSIIVEAETGYVH